MEAFQAFGRTKNFTCCRRLRSFLRCPGFRLKQMCCCRQENKCFVFRYPLRLSVRICSATKRMNGFRIIGWATAMCGPMRCCFRNWELEQLPRGNVRAFGQAEARLLEFLQTHPYITVSRCRRVTGLKIGPSIELLATLLRWNIIDILPHLEGVAYRLKPN